jgi:hypothetical protein
MHDLDGGHRNCMMAVGFGCPNLFFIKNVVGWVIWKGWAWLWNGVHSQVYNMYSLYIYVYI